MGLDMLSKLAYLTLCRSIQLLALLAAMSRVLPRGWIDVLVRAEDVPRVIGSLDGGQTRVVLPVGSSYAAWTLVTEVVDVHRLLQVRSHRLEQRCGPFHVAVRVGRLGPLRQDQEVVLCGPMRECRGRWGTRLAAPCICCSPTLLADEGICGRNSIRVAMAASVRSRSQPDFQ